MEFCSSTVWLVKAPLNLLSQRYLNEISSYRNIDSVYFTKQNYQESLKHFHFALDRNNIYIIKLVVHIISLKNIIMS